MITKASDTPGAVLKGSPNRRGRKTCTEWFGRQNGNHFLTMKLRYVWFMREILDPGLWVLKWDLDRQQRTDTVPKTTNVWNAASLWGWQHWLFTQHYFVHNNLSSGQASGPSIWWHIPDDLSKVSKWDAFQISSPILWSKSHSKNQT